MMKSVGSRVGAVVLLASLGGCDPTTGPDVATSTAAGPSGPTFEQSLRDFQITLPACPATEVDHHIHGEPAKTMDVRLTVSQSCLDEYLRGINLAEQPDSVIDRTRTLGPHGDWTIPPGTYPGARLLRTDTHQVSLTIVRVDDSRVTLYITSSPV